jgi:hypothetical protein
MAWLVAVGIWLGLAELLGGLARGWVALGQPIGPALGDI